MTRQEAMYLHRRIGNRAVGELLARRRHSPPPNPAAYAAPAVRSAPQAALQRRADPTEEEEVIQEQSEAEPRQFLAMPGEEEPPPEDDKPIQRQPNKTGLPDRLKAGVEHLSGVSMDDVRVHYNSSKPAPLQALAYTQGTEIHVGPGQEKHLPHEAWHAAQQKQGRVKPTIQAKAVAINDDADLEKEADVMGAKAMQMKTTQRQGNLEEEESLHGMLEPVRPETALLTREASSYGAQALNARSAPIQRTPVEKSDDDITYRVDLSVDFLDARVESDEEHVTLEFPVIIDAKGFEADGLDLRDRGEEDEEDVDEWEVGIIQNVTESYADVTYRSDDGKETYAFRDTLPDGIYLDSSEGVIWYGGGAGLRDMYDATPADYDSDDSAAEQGPIAKASNMSIMDTPTLRVAISRDGKQGTLKLASIAGTVRFLTYVVAHNITEGDYVPIAVIEWEINRAVSVNDDGEYEEGEAFGGMLSTDAQEAATLPVMEGPVANEVQHETRDL